MVIITQNTVNQVIVTLTEKKQSATKIYLFEFVNQQSKDKVYCVSSDLSTSPNRYNLFCINETSQASGGTNPLDSDVPLPLAGFYYYNVYENPGSVLSPVGLNQVETGKALIIANKTKTVPVYVSDTASKKVVYNPEIFLKS